MRDEIVAREPRRSGLMLLRLARGTDGFVLDLAPAIDEPTWRGRPIELDLDTDVQDPTFGSETVIVAGAAVTLPCAYLRLERGVGPDRAPDAAPARARAPLVYLTFG